MPLDPKADALDRAHNVRVIVGFLTFCGVGFLCAQAPSDSGIGFFVMAFPIWYGLMATWRRRDAARLEKAFEAPPLLPSDLESWDTTLRMRTGKPQSEIDRELKALISAEARRRYWEQQDEAVRQEIRRLRGQ